MRRRFAAPCEGEEHLHFGGSLCCDLCGGLGRRCRALFGRGVRCGLGGRGGGFLGTFGCFGRCLGGRFSLGSLGGLELGALAALGLVTQTLHQIGELLQRHAGDREHVGLGLEPGPAVLGAQHVGQTFQHVDANRPLARGAVARHDVEFGMRVLDRGHGDQTRRRGFGEFVQTARQRPEHKAQAGGRGFQQKRHENGELTEADAMLAQGAARLLIQRLDLFDDAGAGQDAHVLDHAEGEAAGKAVQRLVAAEGQQGFEQGRDLAVDEMLQAPLDLLRHIGAGFVIDEGGDLRLQGIGPGHEFAHRLIAPHEATLFGEIDLGIGGVVETVRPEIEMRHKRRNAGLTDRLGLLRGGVAVLTEPEPFEAADEFTFDGHFTLVVHFGQKGLLLLEPPQQHGGAAVHKSLGQPRVERIRQSVFYSARGLAPMAFVTHPSAALRDIGPCADKGQTFRECVNLALGAVDAFDLRRQPVIGDAAGLVQEVEDRFQKRGVFGPADATEIGDAADVPEQADGSRVRGAGAHLGDLGQGFEGQKVVGLAGADKQIILGRVFQRGDEGIELAELQGVVAPLQFADGGEAMLHDRFGHLIVQRLGLACHAEGAIRHAAPGAACDLGQFVGRKLAHPPPVEFGQRREGDVVDVEVQPHADGIGGDQIIHIAVLIEFDLRVAGAGRERAHDHGRAAFLAADQFGNRIDIINREPDNRAAGGHPANFLRARIGQLGHPVAAHELRLRHKGRDGAAHRVGAEKQGFMQAPRTQQPVGEDMAAFRIGAKLDLVHGQKIDAHAFGHRFNGADPILGARRHDAFFARDQRHDRGAACADDLVIDLARQQAQRQADDPGPVPQHPFDGVMRLAGIRRPEDRRDP